MTINKNAAVQPAALASISVKGTSMDNNIISFSGNPRQEELWTSPFDRIRRTDEFGNEYWRARELMPLLGYDLWQNFKSAITRARRTVKASGEDISNHFSLLMSISKRGKTGSQKAGDYKLSRMACYLVAMNGDTTKQGVTEAQIYFAVQTRKAEVNAQQERARKELKHKQAVTAYQLSGKSEDWAETRVAAKEATRIQNAAIIGAHETNEPNIGDIASRQNKALFDMSKREIVDYLGLLPRDADKYRDNLGRWANEAVRIAGKEITRQISKSGHQLNNDEIAAVVVSTSREVAKHARALAELDHVDYLSGAPLDENGRALIVRNIRLLDTGDLS